MQLKTFRIATSDEATVIVVAKVGGRGDDFAVYIGWPAPQYIKEPTEDRLYYANKFQDVEEVKDYGDKLGEAPARVLFPQMSGFDYRE